MDRVNNLPYCIVSMDKAIYLIKTPTGMRTIEINYAVIKILNCYACDISGRITGRSYCIIEVIRRSI